MCMTTTTSASSGVCASTPRANSSWRASSRPSYLPAPRGFVGIEAEIVDVVEHEEQGLSVEERVVVRAEEALVGLAAVGAVRRLEIEIVIAADAPPGQAGRAEDRVRARIQRQIVEHDVAGVEPEFRVDAGQRLNRVLADEIHLRLGLGLRVGHHHDVEGLRLVLPAEGEIERSGHGRRRREALESQVERARRALGLMMAVEAGQAGQRIDRRHEPGRLDDEDRRLVRQRQRVTPVGARDRDIAAVGDEDIGEPRIGGARDA